MNACGLEIRKVVRRMMWYSTEHCVNTDYILYVSMYSMHACLSDSVNSDALHNSILVVTQQCNECQ